MNKKDPIFSTLNQIGVKNIPVEPIVSSLEEYEDGGNIQQLNLFDNQVSGEQIDQLERKLRMKYDDLALREMYDLSDNPTEQRKALIDWIKNDSNNVNVIIAFSGGKDSVAMVLYCLYVLQIPKERLELWHHDVDGAGEQLFDWACTPSYCKSFADTLGLKLLNSYANGGILREVYRENEAKQSVFYQKYPDGPYHELKSRGWEKDINTRLKFPSVSADLNTRWCSAVAKIDVMRKVINNWDRFDNANVVILSGERRQESRNRARYAEIERSINETKTRKAIQWRPIIDWTEKQVWEIIEQYKIQPHPCYMLGWGRCSCQLCIFSSANTWASLNDISPEKVARIGEIEQDLKRKSEAIVERETMHPETMKTKINSDGVAVKVPFQSIPYLYGDKIKEEQLVEAKTIEKDGKTRSYKEKVAMVWTGKRKNIYEARVNNGKSFVSDKLRERWMNEALGQFVSPIIVNDWQLPAGAFNTENSGAD